jgi:hypothetical protein
LEHKSQRIRCNARSNVIHGLLDAGKPIDLLHELLKSHFVQNIVGGLGEAFVDEAHCGLAGGKVGGGDALFFLDGEAAFEAADEIADGDFAGMAGESIAAAAADLAFEEPPPPEGEENGFEEFVGEVFLLGEIAGLDESRWPEAGQLNYRA